MGAQHGPWQWYHSQSGPLAFPSTRCNSLCHLQSVCPVPLYFLLSCSSSIFLSSYHPISKASLSFYIPPLIFASSVINLSLSHSTWLNTKGLRALLDPTKRDNKTTTTNYIHSCIAQESETMWRTAVRANIEWDSHRAMKKWDNKDTAIIKFFQHLSSGVAVYPWP